MIQQSLRDSGSAQVRRSYVRAVGDSMRVVCGEVNAKNGFGGYAGYERFVGRVAVLGPQMERKFICPDVEDAMPVVL
jgi:hypothetical protein